ncbi:MAG: hypothetical protein H6822_21840 [Planctomycetaceae bacterium]|nr:hypothetical protein [Planctomycetales bacterium]MCB9924838.1 hypothetical protein [Planctomycetaceae bacterium]
MHFRFPRLLLFGAVTAVLGLQSVLVAQTPEPPMDRSIGDKHAWAHFGIGSWKLVRVYTEAIGANGQVESVSITETKTTLDKADEQGYSLNVEVTVEVAGKRFQAEPKYVSYGYHGELLGQTIEVKQLGPSHAEICGHKYPTGSRQIVIITDTTQSTSTVEYSDAVAPYYLKRTTESIDNETKARNYHSVVEVLAVDMPEKVLTEVKSAAHVKTIETFENGTSKVTLEVHCESVPGGVVSHTSKQLNSDGRITQRSTLELLDYRAIEKPPAKVPVIERRRLFPGRRRN